MLIDISGLQNINDSMFFVHKKTQLVHTIFVRFFNPLKPVQEAEYRGKCKLPNGGNCKHHIHVVNLKDLKNF